MKCNECQETIKEPMIDGDTAYWICESCGSCTEAPAKQPTLSELVERFEQEYSVSLPKAYLELAIDPEQLNFHHLISISSPQSTSPIWTYIGDDGYYEVSRLFGVTAEENGSIFCTDYMVKEWELPAGLVLLQGDGHLWLALDFRFKPDMPSVILIESDEASFIQLADSFDSLLKALVPYESVYDEDGNKINTEQDSSADAD